MRLLYSTAFVAAAITSPSNAASPNYETAYNELQGCHAAFGNCYYGGGLLPFSRTDCTAVGLPWMNLVQSADDLETEGNGSTLKVVRLKDGATAEDFIAQAGPTPAGSFLFCGTATYVFSDVEPASVSEFQIGLPDYLKYSPAYFINSLDTAKGGSNEFGLDMDYNPFPNGINTVKAILKPSARASAAKVLERWEKEQTRRRRLGGSVPGISVQSAQKLDLNAPVSSLTVSLGENNKEGMDFLSSMPDVLSIEPVFENEFYNGEAALVTMEGLENVGTFTAPGSDLGTSMPDKLSLWKAGLKGKGQIVGVGDSGLDTEHCFFSDLSKDEAANKATRLSATDPVHNYPDHRKVVQYVAFVDGYEGEDSGHGTHVAGSVAGQLSYDTQGNETLVGGFVFDSAHSQGMAPEAKIAMFDIGNATSGGLNVPDDFEDLFKPSYGIGARIHTNSWGARYNAYLEGSQSIDKFAHENQDMLILFAAGNSGPRIFTLGYQAQAKNILSVGASQNSQRSFANMAQLYSSPTFACDSDRLGSGLNCAQSMAYFSSIGPTYDGRIKPDVVAPGQFIFSARSAGGDGKNAQPTCDVVEFQGTSMATPVTAGNIALVRQFFVDGFYPTGTPNAADGFNPMGALLKAVVLDGAEFLQGIQANVYRNQTGQVVREVFRNLAGTSRPSTVQGFGRIFLRNTLKLEGSFAPGERNVWLRGDMNKKPTLTRAQLNHTYSFTMAAGEEVKATLVWFDPEASTVATGALVNDLDIKIVDPNGETWYPNGLTSPDRQNTAEKVVIPAGSVVSGEYEVVVSAATLNFDNQAYSIVVSGSLEDFPTESPTTSPTFSPTGSPTFSPTESPTLAANETSAPTTKTGSEGAAGDDDGVGTTVALVGGIVGGTLLSIAMIWAGIKCFKPEDEKVAVAEELAVNPKYDA